MKNIKTSYLWLIVLALFLGAIGFIIGCAYTSGAGNTVLIVLLVIDFIALTMFIQLAINKSFRYKAKERKYPAKDYTIELDIVEVLEREFERTEKDFGANYLKIVGKNAFKVSIINDSKLYFNQELEENPKPNKALDRCERMVGLEIFNNPTPEDLKKLPDFTMEADRIYYTALAYIDGKYRCLNYLEPTGKHKDNLLYLYKLLGLSEVSENNEIL